MTGRTLPHPRLRRGFPDTVNRALKELITAGAVAVEHRHDTHRRQLTNRYPALVTRCDARLADVAASGGSQPQ
jgi:hypothetical protein